MHLKELSQEEEKMSIMYGAKVDIHAKKKNKKKWLH